MGYYKAKWDAVVGAKSNITGIGITVRDHRGEVIDFD